MQTKTFCDGEAVRLGWKTMKENIGFFIGIFLAGIVAAGIPIGISVALSGRSAALSVLFMIVYYVVLLVLSVGYTKIFIRFARGDKPEFADLFNSWDRVLPYLGVSILYGLIVLGGTILLVFPGIIWTLKFYFAPYLVIDKGMGPVEALRTSAEMTNGVKWDLFGFMAVAGVVVMIGYFALLIGLFASIPVAAVAIAFVYVKLSGGVQARAAKVEAPAEKK